MKWFRWLLLVMLIGLQYRLWVGAGSMADVRNLQLEVAQQQQLNDQKSQRNQTLVNEVLELKQGASTVEQFAREELGMIKKDETFYLFTGSDQSP
ncbi:MAG: septum formation initiator family protein [Pseudomonadales bacterium]|nr:septum formation initiator family protein [Pseudomonadales bacterium]